MITKTNNNFIFTTFFNKISDGKLNVVTDIIKANTVPSNAPLASSASAIGITPNISAYIGTPNNVAMMTPNGLSLPNIDVTHASGIQLCINAPIPTPMRM